MVEYVENVIVEKKHHSRKEEIDLIINRGKRMKPPKTKRQCINCERETTFTYNRTLGHSECEECGFRFAKNTKVTLEGKIYRKCNECKQDKICDVFSDGKIICKKCQTGVKDGR
jgi:hypothetical protein